MRLSNPTVAVVGLGYVGLPLAVCFSKKYSVIAFDVNELRIDELKLGKDHTQEVDLSLVDGKNLHFTTDNRELSHADVVLVTVPTPVDSDNRPDLKPIRSACLTIGQYMQNGAVIVFESTVFPGCTEEVCVPLLEDISGLSLNEDFYVGYSPERINPGDAERRIENIVKITSGSSPDSAVFIDQLYSSVIDAGTYMAESIKVAEAAKVIENTQRDLNIALINELAIIFKRMGIDTHDVLEAAGTKWNFLNFKPGLVGGHCIGVDPYYLTHKAERLGYRPEVILAGRRINDNMPAFVASRVLKAMLKKQIPVASARVLVLGVTFKENCPDIRNSKVFDLIDELRDYDMQVDCYDPVADMGEVLKQHGIAIKSKIRPECFDIAILAVAHQEIIDVAPSIKSLLKRNHVVYDLKGILPANECDERL